MRHLGDEGYKPLLPRGNALFDAIPLGALVIEALAPTLKDGAILVTRPDTLGVVLVRGGALSETFLFQDDQRVLGVEALDRIRALPDAIVSAYALDPALVDCAPALLRGDASYQDLHLAWTDWKELIADLLKRPGTHVIEVETPRGRGVTCIRDGAQVGSYTEKHPQLGDLSLLDELISGREGTIWIRNQPGALDTAAAAVNAPGSPVHAAPEPAALAVAPPLDELLAADLSSAPIVVDQPAAVTMPPLDAPAAVWPPVVAPAALASEPAPAPEYVDVPAPWASAPPPMVQPSADPQDAELAEDELTHGASSTLPPQPSPGAAPDGNPLESAFSDIFTAGAADLGTPVWPPAPESGLPAWPPPAGSTPPRTNGAHPDQLESSVSQLLPAFKQIARARLQRSALRVETMLDDAAGQGRPVEAVLAEIRGLTIRGVMQSTLDQVVDEMMAVALEHHQ